MRTTVRIDESLLSLAQDMTGITSRNAILKEALEALIQRESARRLAKLGGSEPQMTDIPRRKNEKE
jgi:Arc/MetJ family transcription regulator